MRVVLDTGVLYRPAALRRLAAEAWPVVLPATAFLERARQRSRDRTGDMETLESFLTAMGMRIEPFGPEEARRSHRLVRARTDAEWRRMARDAQIAGHVGADDILWTTNPRDFLALGVPAAQVYAVD
ncbi:MAG: hypothetical protein ACYDDF_03490 [Thermoplasmatota archaeon]